MLIGKTSYFWLRREAIKIAWIMLIINRIYEKYKIREILKDSSEKNLGVKGKKLLSSASQNKKFFKWILGLGAGFLNGIFGSGGGTLLVPGMERFLEIQEHKAHASAIAVILPLTGVSLVFYLPRIELSWSVVLWVIPGSVAGGYFGARWLKKIPGPWLHRIFGGAMLLAAIRMLSS